MKNNLLKTFRWGGMACAFLMISVLFYSCKKDETTGGGGGNTNTPYYFKATMNGEPYDFLHAAKYQAGGNDGRIEHIVIAGDESPYPPDYDPTDIESMPHQFGIEFWNLGGDITTGTYTAAGTDDWLYANYLIQTNSGTINYSSDTDYGGSFELTITEIGDQGIKGTFKGKLIYAGDMKTVRDGSFYLPYEELVNP